MKLSEFGQELEKQFGWDFARLTTPPSAWDRIKKAIAGFFKGEFLMKSETTGKTIREDVQDIALSDARVKPSGATFEELEAARNAMVTELKRRGHSEEDITKFFGPRGKE